MSSSNERKLLLPKEEFDPNLATNFTTKGKILTLKEKKELKRIQEEKRQDESIIKSLINSSNGKIQPLQEDNITIQNSKQTIFSNPDLNTMKTVTQIQKKDNSGLVGDMLGGIAKSLHRAADIVGLHNDSSDNEEKRKERANKRRQDLLLEAAQQSEEQERVSVNNSQDQNDDDMADNDSSQQLSDASDNENEIGKGAWGGAQIGNKLVELVQVAKQNTMKSKKYDGGKNKKLAGLDMLKGSMLRQKTSALSSMMTSIGSSGDEIELDAEDKSKSVGMSEFGSYIKNKVENKDLRSVYMENYGVQMEFPAYYLSDARFVPHIDDYVVTLAWHIIPKNKKQIVQSTWIDGRVEECSFMSTYQQTGKSIRIRLAQTDGRNGLKTLKELQLFGVHKALIEFSSTGEWFAVYTKKERILNVFKSKDIIKCFENIENDKPDIRIQFKEDVYEKGDRIIFDKQNKYVAVQGDQQVVIVSLQAHNLMQIVKLYDLDTNQYTMIHDLILDSQGCPDGKYKCVIAVRLAGLTNIHVFDINEENPKRSIAFLKNSQNIIVKIADDMNKVIFSNGFEHYMLNDTSQDNFPWIKDKFVRNVINHEDGFFLVTSKDYDRDIDILHSDDEDFNVSYLRQLEPGILKVFDSMILTRDGQHKPKMRTLMKIGDYLYLDETSIDLSKKDKHLHSLRSNEVTDRSGSEDKLSIVDRHYLAYGFNWPYFSYGTRNKKILIYNAFNPYFIQRYELPYKTTIVLHTFITDTHDIYIMVETNDEHFEIYHIDLDSTNPFIQGPVLRYPFSLTDGETCQGFHVRGSSQKEKVNLNKKLMCFMLHDNKLFGWDGELTLIAENAWNMYYMSDDEFFYMTTKEIIVAGKQVEHSEIFMVECKFGNYSGKEFVYKDRNLKAEILNFGVDNTRKRLIILTGIKNIKNKRDKFVTIFDINNEKVLHQIQIQSREIIGRLKSNLYNFVEGHIYYGNSVIKIRYDLLEKMAGQYIKENHLFDTYHKILSLKDEHDYVQSGTPYQTCLYNRLAYIIRNSKKLKPRKLMILPYLHERRIYLNRRHNANQFYTIFNISNINFILCFCIPDNKVYVYTETGILVDRIIYKEIAEQCGKPRELSEDASKILFRKGEIDPMCYLINVTIDGLKIYHQVNIHDQIKELIDNLRQKEIMKDAVNFYDVFLDQLKDFKKIKISFCLNDYGDILIRVKPSPEFLQDVIKQREDLAMFADSEQEDQTHNESIVNSSIFCYVPSPNHKENQSFIYFDGPEDDIVHLQGVSMNEKFIFFWNLGSIWKLEMKTQNFTKMNLYISEKEIHTFVKKVRTGSDENICCIRVQQSAAKDCIIVWDLQNDIEIESFDVNHDSIFFQDRLGNPFIAQENFIINCRKGARIRSYNFKITDFDTENCKFKFQYGSRVEDKSHNWLIFRNFINLSFSYMTFVIKENFDKMGFLLDDFLFDLEGYDYILNKETMFTEGTLVTQQFDKLNFILQNYADIDIKLLEQLHYPNGKNKLPIHKALEAKNNRMVNLILDYMSRIEFAAVGLFKDIFKELVSYQGFENYLWMVPFQTIQMINKQTLIIKKAQDQEIITVSGSDCSYVDEDYFCNDVGEQTNNPNYLTYAVNIQAIRADWIINHPEGILFLKEMLRQKRKELFMTPYVKIITQFLYKNYSRRIMNMLLPSYCMHQVCIFLYLFVSEQQRDNVRIFAEEESQELQATISKTSFFITILVILMLISTLLNSYIFVKQTINLGTIVLKRLWSWVDLIVISLNLFIVMNHFALGVEAVKMRPVEATLSIAMWFKSLYYLSLVGEIAPLVDIIFVIFKDIRYFMVIFLIALIAFINAFYIIGRNQEDIDRINRKTLGNEAGEPVEIEYATWMNAAHHVYLASLGEFNTDNYFLDDSMSPVCIILFLLLSFFMCIHLLNMLIAIMGESFAKNNEIGESKKRMSQLNFVVDNWWLDPIQNKERVIYIVASFAVNLIDDNDDQKFTNLSKQMSQLAQSQDLILKQIQNLESQVLEASFKNNDNVEEQE